MIVVNLQVSEHESRVAQLDAYGFDPEVPSEADEHKEALGRIMVSTPTWMLTVSDVVRYLITRCFTYNWRIRVMKGRREIRRFESLAHPPPDQVVQEPPRVSRYARPPVI